MQKTKNMRVLIISEACNPKMASLPSFAYQYALAISSYADVVVVTQIRNYRNLKETGIGNAEVVYINTEKIAAPLYKFGVYLRGGKEKGWNIRNALDYPSCLAFERYAWKRFKKDLINKKFDVVHRMTPVSPNLPSFIAKRCPVPFLLGPVNGFLPWPSEIKPVMTREMVRGERFILPLLRAYKKFPYYKSTYDSASGILACFDHTLSGFPKHLQSKIINFPEVGLDPKQFMEPSKTHKKKLTVIFVGRLVPYKMPDIIIQAFANSNILRQHKLLIVGDGPERYNLEKLASDNNLNGCLEFKGQQSWSNVAQLMKQSDIFAFPSVHENGGGVVVEAMACGLACIVVDYGGPHTLIADNCGIKIPLRNIAEVCKQFQYELEQLVTNPDRVLQMGRSANKHAMAYYTWDAKARKTLEIYYWLTGKQKHKPDYWDQPITFDRINRIN